MTSLFLVFLFSALAAIALGYVFGLSITAHRYATAGIHPKTQNRFVHLMTRPTASYNRWERCLFLVYMLLWMPAFFGLIAAPVITSSAFGINDRQTVKAAYIVFGCTAGIAWYCGARTWKTLLQR